MQTETTTVTVETAKAAWATPVIESYDVAAFTLANGQNAGDGGVNQS